MELNLTEAIKVTTNYNFKKYRGEQLIQEENTHNIITDNLFTAMNTDSSGWRSALNFNTLYLGSGTTEPTSADTALTSLLWNKGWSNISNDAIATENTITSIQTFEIPASADYVGTIAECGLGNSMSTFTLMTHALLRDAEGNPITIEKTDLDRLVINVTLVFSFTLPEGVYLINLENSALYYNLKFTTNARTLSSWVQRNTNICYDGFQTAYLSQDYQEMLDNGMLGYRDSSRDNSWECTAGCSNGLMAAETDAIATIPAERTKNFKGRIGDSIVVGDYVAYFKAVVFLGLFIIPLPNNTYFPEYTMQNIDLGVGDGTTTEFKNPLNYFKKDTDKIYKNGVLLTRNVDYTIDHANNAKGLVELFASADAIISGGLTTYAKNTPLFRPQPCCMLRTGSYDGWWGRASKDAFDTEHPLFLDMKKEVPVNYLRIGKTAYAQAKYSLYYKPTDEEDFVLLCTFNKTDSLFEQTFETVTARYFKLTIEPNSGTGNVSSGNINYTGANSTYSVGSSYTFKASLSSISVPENFCSLGCKGSAKIVFAQAPAEGDVLTMEVTMDLPMKNKNNVIDYDFTLTF